METSNYLRVIQGHKLLIRANIHKLPKYFEYMYDDTDNELNDELNTYKKDGIINEKYYSLLESVGKFINKYDIDVSVVKKSTLDLINSYCRIKNLNKACFSEPEEINDEINETDDETDDESEINDNNTNEKRFISDEEHETDLRIILKDAIKTTTEN